jgi:hypothetical protein
MTACLILVGLVISKPPTETKLKPVAVYSGTHSQIRNERFRLATTADAWKGLWELHRGNRDVRAYTEPELQLDIDFDTHYVVAMFSGSCDWCHVNTVRRGDTVVIWYKPCFWSTEGRQPGVLSAKEKLAQEKEEQRQAALAPYVFVVLPKPVKTVVIEQNVQTRRDESPIWKHRHTFAAPADPK